MCTAISFYADDYYFGRNLDYEFDFGQKVVITPRNFLFSFENGETSHHHYAIIGMAVTEKNYPLYFDATNEIGDRIELSVCIEIMGKYSNLILLSDNRIIDSIKRVDYTTSSVRQILPGLEYVLPPKQDKICIEDASVDEISKRYEYLRSLDNLLTGRVRISRICAFIFDWCLMGFFTVVLCSILFLVYSIQGKTVPKTNGSIIVLVMLVLLIAGKHASPFSSLDIE